MELFHAQMLKQGLCLSAVLGKCVGSRRLVGFELSLEIVQDHPEAQPLKDGIEQFPAACRGHHAVEKGDGLPTVGIAVYLVIECSAVYLKFCHSE